MIDPKILKDFCSTLTLDDLYSYLIRYIVNHSYFSCKGVSADLLFREFGICRFTDGYGKCKKSILYRLSTFIPDLVKGGIIEKYSNTLYKVIREGRNGNGKVEFEVFIRANGSEESLYLTIPVKATRQYNLVKNKRAMVNVEILD